MDWSGVDYLWIIVMFLSAVWTLILTAPIHCRGSNGEQVMQCYISTNLSPWRNKLIYILDGLRPESKFSAYFLFWVNYSFNLLSAPNKLLCYLNNCFYFSSHSLMWISHNQRVQLDRPRLWLHAHLNPKHILTYIVPDWRKGVRTPSTRTMFFTPGLARVFLLFAVKLQNTTERTRSANIIYSCIGKMECAFSFFTLNQHWMYLFILFRMTTFAEYSKMDNNWTDYW